jgi:hypothetical protein
MLHLVDKRADEQVWTFRRVLLAVPNFYVAVAFEMGDTLYAVPFLSLRGEGGVGRVGVGSFIIFNMLQPTSIMLFDD